MTKKIFAALFAFILVFDIMSITVFAAETVANRSGVGSTNLVTDLNINKTTEKVVYDNKIQASQFSVITNAIKAFFNKGGSVSLSQMELEQKKEELSSKISFSNDIRLFTLFTFLNYTGYGSKNSNEDFEPIRNDVMNDLKELSFKLQDNKYFTNKELSTVYYINTLRNMGNTPNFEIVGYKGNIPEKLGDLPKVLKEFYGKANIEKLYKSYNKTYQTEFADVEDKVLSTIAIINETLKIDVDSVPEIGIEINLLDKYNKNSNFVLYDNYLDKTIITVSPNNESYVQNIIHEYLHCIVNPIIDDLYYDVNRLAYLEKGIPKYSNADIYSKNWTDNVENSLVFALEYRFIEGGKRTSVKEAVNEGYLLTDYFDEKLDSFRSSKVDFKTFVKQTLVKYYNSNRWGSCIIYLI